MYKVLLVDDEYMILKGLEKLIAWEKLGLELVGTASNGQEAYDFVQSNHIDIVVTDVNMPIMNGIKFVRRTQEQNLNFFVVLLSGYQEFEYVKEGIQLGVENFLLKPIDKNMLNETLENIVRKLEDEKNRLESDKLVFSNTLSKWIMDDIESTDLRRLLKLTNFPLDAKSQYSVLLFEKNIPNLDDFFRSQDQYLFFDNHDEIVLIFKGDIDRFNQFRLEMKEAYDVETILKGVGELFVDQEHVASSYEQASQNASFASFYQDHPIKKLLQEQNTLDDPKRIIEQDFSKFHQALSLRDESLIFQELNALLRQLKEEKADPNFIRYNAFILISDIYREFGISDAEIMNESMHTIYDSVTMKNIETTLYRIYHEVSVEQKEISYSDLVKDLLSVLMERYYEDLSLISIAEELHVNSMYLGQLFKKELGVSFSRYLNSYRIKKAQELIVNTNLNFSEISEEVGYSSPGYFYKKFKKECGFSPSEYRNKYRGK